MGGGDRQQHFGEPPAAKVKAPRPDGTAAPIFFRAGDRPRTGDVQLGKLAFYQLNYARVPLKLARAASELHAGGRARRPKSLRVELPAHVQVVPVQHGVEHEEVAADRL